MVPALEGPTNSLNERALSGDFRQQGRHDIHAPVGCSIGKDCLTHEGASHARICRYSINDVHVPALPSVQRSRKNILTGQARVANKSLHDGKVPRPCSSMQGGSKVHCRNSCISEEPLDCSDVAATRRSAKRYTWMDRRRGQVSSNVAAVCHSR